MITRIMLSLKKAADPRNGGWALGEPPDVNRFKRMTFYNPRRGANEMENDIPLDTYPEVLIIQ